jgi:hypothetical protein
VRACVFVLCVYVCNGKHGFADVVSKQKRV